MNDFDVLVIGSGVAGLRAANAAADAGATVAVIEAESDIGGRSQYSTGGLLGAGTRFQLEAGVDDSPAALYEHYRRINHWRIDAGVAHRLAFECGPEIEWLAENGLEILKVAPGADSDVPRVHRTRGGHAIVDVLRSRAQRLGCEMIVGQRIERLVVDDGVVRGVATATEELSAGAVVLATGGLGGNPRLLQRLAPSLVAATGDWLLPVGGRELARYAQGDAIGLGESVGAALAGVDVWEATIRPGYAEVSLQLLPGWIMIVDRAGRRIVDETADIVEMQSALLAAGGEVYAIFDDAAKSAAEPPPSAPGATRARRVNPDWRSEVIDAMVAQGSVYQAESLADLAVRAGVDVEALSASARRYNEHVAAGVDVDHRKDPRVLRALDSGPYYAVPLRLGSIAYTSAGPKIDSSAQVVDRSGQPIPGLFAGGECAGGVVGVHLGGNPLASCLVFGRTAGEAAARHAQRRAEGPASGS